WRVLADIEVLAYLGSVRPLHRRNTAADPETDREGHRRAHAAQRAEMQLRPRGAARREQSRPGVVAGQLAQRRDVVENPERAAMRARDQIAELDLEIIDRHHRQAAGQ